MSGRPTLVTNIWTIENGWTPRGTDYGARDHVTTPIVVTDKVASVPAQGSVTIDVTGGAVGGNGTIGVDSVDELAPDRGMLVHNGDGTVTYTPDHVWENEVDEFYVFLRSGDTMFKTVRINVIIGDGGAAATPMETTNFTVTTGVPGELLLTLDQQSETHGRHIRLTMYSTDNGATWRRLTNHWPQKVHHVTLASDGTALTAGNYTVRIRYEHDHEYAYATSTDVPVTVT